MSFHKLVIALTVCWFGSVLCVAQSGPLHLEKEIPLPDVEGRIDHLSVDVAGERLFVSALGNGTVEVIDLKQGKRATEIKGLKSPQGVLYGEDSKIYAASDGDGTLRVYDGQTFSSLKTLELGDDADNVRYDGQSKEVLVGYGSGGLAAFDHALQKAYGIKLSAHPESFQLQQHGPLIYVNLPESEAIAVIDRKQRKIIHEWKETAALSNFPMALDEANNRLFVGCRRPARLLVLDSASADGKAVTSLPTVGDTDDLFYDSARKQIYVIGGEGYVDVFRQSDADHYEQVTRIKTAPGARTGLFVSARNQLFVAVPHRGAQTAKVLVYATSESKP